MALDAELGGGDHSINLRAYSHIILDTYDNVLGAILKNNTALSKVLGALQ